MVLETVRQFEPIVRTLTREGIAPSLRIDPISLRVWYCGDDEEEEEEEEEKKQEEEEEEDEDDDEEEEDEEWKISRPEKGAAPPGCPSVAPPPMEWKRASRVMRSIAESYP